MPTNKATYIATSTHQSRTYTTHQPEESHHREGSHHPALLPHPRQVRPETMANPSAPRRINFLLSRKREKKYLPTNPKCDAISVCKFHRTTRLMSVRQRGSLLDWRAHLVVSSATVAELHLSSTTTTIHQPRKANKEYNRIICWLDDAGPDFISVVRNRTDGYWYSFVWNQSSCPDDVRKVHTCAKQDILAADDAKRIKRVSISSHPRKGVKELNLHFKAKMSYRTYLSSNMCASI